MLAAEIERDGHDFVGQEVPSLSTAPRLVGRRQARGGAGRAARLRRGHGRTATESCRAGSTRVADGSDPRAAWLEAGDVSKDTWVLSDEPVEQFSLLAQRQAAARIHRSGRDLPSRAADNLFWLGRYAERAEGAVQAVSQSRDPACAAKWARRDAS